MFHHQTNSSERAITQSFFQNILLFQRNQKSQLHKNLILMIYLSFKKTWILLCFGANINWFFPKPAKLVKSICGGPPATVASDSDFSMGSDFVWAKCNKLSSRNLHHLTFVKRRLKAETQEVSPANQWSNQLILK